MHSFLENLDPDFRKAVLTQLRNLWTHTSTAIEGNTLTLGETAFVLEQGLTISGKPLKDHEEVVGHARAIDLLHELVGDGREFSEADLFTLHRAVQTEVVVDVYKPVGAWKREANSTVGIVDGRQVVFEYPEPALVPRLMADWFALHRDLERTVTPDDMDSALRAHAHLHLAFVLIHPFFDGNGRLARLVANLPLLKAGFPPIVFPLERRREYLEILASCHNAVGRVGVDCSLPLPPEQVDVFAGFCREVWRETMAIIEDARVRQRRRQGEKDSELE